MKTRMKPILKKVHEGVGIAEDINSQEWKHVTSRLQLNPISCKCETARDVAAMHSESRMDIDVQRERQLIKEGIPSSTPVVVTNLQKKFGDFVAVRDISLHIPKSTVFALLGPNGAAKTTFINLLTGLLEPDEGEIFLLGHQMTN